VALHQSGRLLLLRPLQSCGYCSVWKIRVIWVIWSYQQKRMLPLGYSASCCCFCYCFCFLFGRLPCPVSVIK
jgi:hypothetical protein